MTRLEAVLALTIVSLGGVGAYVGFQNHTTQEAAARSGGAAGGTNGAPQYSSRVLSELAKERKSFAQWMASVADGSATNDGEWLLLGDDETTNSPEYIARTRLIAQPGGESTRGTNRADYAGGSVSAAAKDGDSAAAASAAGVEATKKKSKISKTEQKLASRLTEEQLRAKTEASIVKKLGEISNMTWSPQAEAALSSTMVQWAKLDPQSALNYALSIESRRARVNAINNVLGTWAKADPAAAQQWFLANMPQDPLAASATVRNLYTGMGKAQMDAALQTVSQLPTVELQNLALQTLMSQVVRGGDESAIQNYFATVTDPKQRDYLATSMANTWAAYQPSVAAEWVSRIADPIILNRQVSALAATWAFDDPEGASMWATSLSDPRLRYTTVQQTTRTWAREDPVEAADWALSLNPPSPQADPAVAGLVGAIMNAHPEGAMQWASSASDPALRVSLMRSVGRVWMAQNPSAASLYIQQSDLSQTIKNQLLATTIRTPVTTTPK